jgi:hypothetical protein
VVSVGCVVSVGSVVSTVVQSPEPESVCWKPLDQVPNTVNSVPDQVTVTVPAGPIEPE